ncbi:MAG: PQQ-binding-like beta-propeller repeat protein, partial [Woeseiaceae bacterium]
MSFVRILLAGLLFAAGVSCAQSGPDLSDINLPDGFSIEIWTDQVPNARSLALGDQGTVFVATRRDGRVYAVSEDASGTRSVVTIARDLKMPNGVAFRDGSLYVAENHRIIRFDDIESRLGNIP